MLSLDNFAQFIILFLYFRSFYYSFIIFHNSKIFFTLNNFLYQGKSVRFFPTISEKFNFPQNSKWLSLGM